MTIWRMRIPCWIPKATETHSKYVIISAFPQQQWLRERDPVLRYTQIACLVTICVFHKQIVAAKSPRLIKYIVTKPSLSAVAGSESPRVSHDWSPYKLRVFTNRQTESKDPMFNLEAMAKRKTAASASTWSRSSDPYPSQYQDWVTEEYSDNLSYLSFVCNEYCK
jgi:hypothetical protein